MHAGGGSLQFFGPQTSTLPYRFVIRLTDHGPGIPELEAILAGQTNYAGLVGVNRLVDDFRVETPPNGGCAVTLEKVMPLRTKAFSTKEIDELTSALARLASGDPVDEVQRQNQELLEALEQLSTKQIELDKANSELNRSNAELSTLNNEMKKLNESLESKVQERTNELVELNIKVTNSRDEAILANKLKSQFVAKRQSRN